MHATINTHTVDTSRGVMTAHHEQDASGRHIVYTTVTPPGGLPQVPRYRFRDGSTHIAYVTFDRDEKQAIIVYAAQCTEIDAQAKAGQE